MKSIYGYYNGTVFEPFESIILPANQKVIITILEEQFPDINEDENPFAEFIGKIDDENCAELLEILKDCEKIDYDEW